MSAVPTTRRRPSIGASHLSPALMGIFSTPGNNLRSYGYTTWVPCSAPDTRQIIIKGVHPNARKSTPHSRLHSTVKMYRSLALTTLTLLSVARAQNVGTLTTENHPKINWKTCTGTGGNSCTTKNAPIVLDSNWRWTHTTSGSTNCYTGNSWDSSLCPDGATCAKNCAIDGADYSGVYSHSPRTTATNRYQVPTVSRPAAMR
jgi:hypothetical protein